MGMDKMVDFLLPLIPEGIGCVLRLLMFREIWQ